MNFHKSGRIEVICGGMFSGKTEELLRRVRRSAIAKQKVQVFKPSLDTRYQSDKVTSHSGFDIEAEVVDSAESILAKLDHDTTVIAIDEVQFFNNKIVEVCNHLANQGKRVICAGLDMDFRGNAFEPIPELMAQAEQVDKFHAICTVCGQEASRTQRSINGKPARSDDPIIKVGANEVYEARCRRHHEVLV